MRRSILIGVILLVLYAIGAWAQAADDSSGGVKAAIKAIWRGAQLYHQDKGEWPATMDTLLNVRWRNKAEYPGQNPDSLPLHSYVEIPPEVRAEWTFSFEQGQPQFVRAESVQPSYGGREPLRLQFRFNTCSGTWQGFDEPTTQDAHVSAEQRAELAANIRNTMRAVWETAKVYYQDRGNWPENVKTLRDQDYIGEGPFVSYGPPEPPPPDPIPTGIFSQWNIALLGQPPQKLVAVSTETMPDGPGKAIEYDIPANAWMGYGVR